MAVSRERQAHPLLIAAIGHELARRAGVPSCVGACAGHPWTVVRGEGSMALRAEGLRRALPVRRCSRARAQE